jgi:hypothetical protein
MGVELHFDGIAQLAKLAAQIRSEGDKGLGKQMGKALDRVVDPLKKGIDASAAQTMPSGYVGLLTRSLKHRKSLRATARTASLRLATTADGKSEKRDLPALEGGQLRHPVFGRRKKPWTVTSVEPGFHQRGTEAAGPLAEKAASDVLDDYADRLTKG